MLPFPEKFLDDLFLVIDHKFRISPQFSLFQYISPTLFSKNYYFPLFLKNSPAFYILYVYFPPYFDHDAFMHHPMHVLDAPDPITNGGQLLPHSP